MLRTIVNGQMLAGTDLTGKKGLQVKLTTANHVNICGAGEAGIGILDNEPKAEQACRIVQYGEVEVVVAGAIGINTPFGSDANGKAVALAYGTDSSKFVHGRTIESASGTVGPNRVVRCFVNMIAPHRAA